MCFLLCVFCSPVNQAVEVGEGLLSLINEALCLYKFSCNIQCILTGVGGSSEVEHMRPH